MRILRHKVAWNYKDYNDRIVIAVANLRVYEDDITSNLDDSPNRSISRFKKFNHLLNSMCQADCDLAVFPEVCLPHQWLQWLTWVSAKRQIGIVVGIEHMMRNNEALNYSLTVLPFRSKGKYPTCYPCLRLKRYYAPKEIEAITGRFLHVPKQAKQQYDLFKWRGVNFAVFNCYELTHIQERGAFRGKVDFLACPEYNPDINYFSNIVESTSRDLHCYVIQSNDSAFGDSRVVAPSKTEQMNLVQVRGGENETFLKVTLDIAQLRKHQRMNLNWQLRKGRMFKPTPAGWDPADVIERSK